MPTAPRPNSETVAALLDTTWRVADGERARTEGLDRKAASLATFASLVLSLTATLGTRLSSDPSGWMIGLYVAGLVTLTLAVAAAVVALVPKEHLGLGMAYLERFPKWSEILKDPVQVRGETMAGLVEAIAIERALNRTKANLVRWAFLLLLVGLAFVVAEASILGIRS
jgi:hypothetical protein